MYRGPAMATSKIMGLFNSGITVQNWALWTKLSQLSPLSEVRLAGATYRLDPVPTNEAWRAGITLALKSAKRT
jgi:hypothetical protein